MNAAPSPPWLLALHSSSDTLGVGLQPLAAAGEDPPPARLAAFPLGRGLANSLLECVESLLPAGQWHQLGRLAVATGPGGFTGTRLTVVLARTLAQQLDLPLDGVGSFLLIAHRLGPDAAAAGPYWLVQDLPRRGLVAGLYGPAPAGEGAVGELLAPRLYRLEQDLLQAQREAGLSRAERRVAEPRLPDDVAALLALAQAAAAAGRTAPWQPVLPQYPTSPVAVD
ncbi:MAG: tRNA (adenosine(37)-N6)-threonylcarbamoyltransferase complex dimerization subunit type 1 TsaB [Synechococcaceae cyanobacterium]|nr:tRNA (adenosine(37)-N6)-threonylcarbamoyltransferase complex dimerization subunit type 1 TsaB [Synechococcaceae cyanobacterium]